MEAPLKETPPSEESRPPVCADNAKRRRWQIALLGRTNVRSDFAERYRLRCLAMCVIAPIVGLCGTTWVISDTLLMIESQKWKITTATVVNDGLEPSFDGLFRTAYSPKVEYRFHVSGRAYQGDKFSIPGRRSRDESRERDRLDPFPLGATIEILYDPADPTRSVINRPQFDYWFTLGIGTISAIFVIAGPVGLYFIKRAPFPLIGA